MKGIWAVPVFFLSLILLVILSAPTVSGYTVTGPIIQYYDRMCNNENFFVTHNNYYVDYNKVFIHGCVANPTVGETVNVVVKDPDGDFFSELNIEPLTDQEDFPEFQGMIDGIIDDLFTKLGIYTVEVTYQDYYESTTFEVVNLQSMCKKIPENELAIVNIDYETIDAGDFIRVYGCIANSIYEGHSISIHDEMENEIFDTIFYPYDGTFSEDLFLNNSYEWKGVNTIKVTTRDYTELASIPLFMTPDEESNIVLRPLMQMKLGVPNNEINCKENFVLIIKNHNERPACVKQSSVDRLTNDGFYLPEFTQSQESNELKISTTYSYGFCMGYCNLSFNITSAEILVSEYSHEKDSSEFPVLEERYPVSEEFWNNLLSKMNIDEFNSLPDVVGCPECVDQGAILISISYGNVSKNVTIDPLEEPPEIFELLKIFHDLNEKYYDEISSQE